MAGSICFGVADSSQNLQIDIFNILSRFMNFGPTLWIRHLEFKKSETEFVISDRKNPWLVISMKVALIFEFSFAILDSPLWFL